MLPEGLHVNAAIVVSAVEPGKNISLRLRLARLMLLETAPPTVPTAHWTLLPKASAACDAIFPMPGLVIKIGDTEED